MKKFNKNFLAAFIGIVVLTFFTFQSMAETPSTVRPNSWNSKQTFNQGLDVKNSPGSPYNVQSKNAAGTATFTVTPAGVATVTGVTGTGVISATNIADKIVDTDFPLCAAQLNGTGIIGNDGTTAPGISTSGTDGLPAIVYGSSSETASIGWSYTVSPNYVANSQSFRMLISSSSTSFALASVGWNMTINESGAAFQLPIAQTQTGPTADFSALNTYITFTPNASAMAALSAGKHVAVYFWNKDTTVEASKTMEIKAVTERHSEKQ